MTCWVGNGKPTVYLVAVMEWKVGLACIDTRDLRWLTAYSKAVSGFTGYATCLDLHARNFGLSCSRVADGRVAESWVKR